jgi:hypothetical protein
LAFATKYAMRPALPPPTVRLAFATKYAMRPALPPSALRLAFGEHRT